MKLKLIADFDEKRKKGLEVEADKIAFDETFGGRFKVRVVGQWKRPQWLAITWFVEIPDWFV